MELPIENPLGHVCRADSAGPCRRILCQQERDKSRPMSCNNFGDEGLKARAPQRGPRLGVEQWDAAEVLYEA